MSAKRLAPPGVQPARDGVLLCLECGSWFRAVGAHIKAHGLTADEYRRRHELPATAKLTADDICQAGAERARVQYPSNKGLQRGLTKKQRLKALSLARQAMRESSTRVGSRIALEQRMAARSQRVRETTRAHYDELAQAHGYANIAEMFAATDHLRDVDVAALLGVSESAAGRARLLYGKRRATDPVARRGQQIRRGTRARYDERARRHGYRDVAHLLRANRSQTDAVVAALLDTSPQTANRLRHDPDMLTS